MTEFQLENVQYWEQEWTSSTLLSWIRFSWCLDFLLKPSLLAGGLRKSQSYLIFKSQCGISRFSSEWAWPWDLSQDSSPNPAPMSLDPLPQSSPPPLCLQGVWLSEPSCSKDGSHKFLKRKDPGWFLLPELWNSEGPLRAQTQPLCRNVGLTGSWELRFLPLTRSQQPQKVVPLCGCSCDEPQLQGTVNLCSSVLSFQLDAAETRQKHSILWTANIWLWKNNPVELPGFKLSMLGIEWNKSRELARDSLFLLM